MTRACPTNMFAPMADLGIAAETREVTPARRMPTQALGLALVTAALAVFLAALTVSGGDEGGFVAILTIVGGLATWLTWKVNKLWAVIVGLVATVAAAMVFFMAFGVLQPFSPFEFIGGLLYVFGFFFALIGGIIALSRRRREAGPHKTGIRVRQTAVGLIGVLAVVSVAGNLMTRTSVSAEAATGAATVDMVDFEFAPVTPTIASGRNLLLTNSDGFVHDFTIDELDIYESLGPGSEAVIDLSDVPAGTYQFYCSLHSDGTTGMAGTMTIEG
jgi:plastocyanin